MSTICLTPARGSEKGTIIYILQFGVAYVCAFRHFFIHGKVTSLCLRVTTLPSKSNCNHQQISYLLEADTVLEGFLSSEFNGHL